MPSYLELLRDQRLREQGKGEKRRAVKQNADRAGALSRNAASRKQAEDGFKKYKDKWYNPQIEALKNQVGEGAERTC